MNDEFQSDLIESNGLICSDITGGKSNQDVPRIIPVTFHRNFLE